MAGPNPIGTEVINIIGVQSNGMPSAQTEAFTLQQIANLGVKARGTFVANGTTPVTVSYTGFARATLISISLNTVGGTVGALPTLQTVTPGTGFTVAASASDTSTYNWLAE